MEEESRNLRSQVDPTTAESNTRSIVHDGVATFTIDNVSTDVKVKAGQVGCFTGTDYTIETTGIIKDKSSRPGVPVWGCRIAGVDYTFDNDGHCTIDDINVSHPENEPHHLWIVASSIDVAEGSTVTGTTRGGLIGTKIVKVDALTPRDTFAIAALEALIHRMDDPIECSTASVRFVTDKAYEFANSMMISSAYARVAAGEDEPSGDSPGTVEVDASTLENNTEKLLNNIHKAIEAFRATIQEDGIPVKGFKNEFNSTTFTKDVQTKVTNIDKVKFDGTPTVTISGTPNVNVSNSPSVTISGTPNVNINNQPTVTVDNMPSEPIEIEGTVSIDNSSQSE